MLVTKTVGLKFILVCFTFYNILCKVYIKLKKNTKSFERAPIEVNVVLRMGLRSIRLRALNCEKKSQLAKKLNATWWRRVRDSNPRMLLTSTVFKTAAFDRSANSAHRLLYYYNILILFWQAFI